METNIGYTKSFLLSKAEVEINGREGLYSKILLNFNNKYDKAKVVKTDINELGLVENENGEFYEFEIVVTYDEDISKLERSQREAEDYITKK
jgi:hypothetical protein